MLLNSEAWVDYSDSDVRIFEQCDKMVLTKILECDGKASKALKYLDLGVIPIHLEIMKRILGFLRYILNQDKDSMIFNILKATKENPVKKDFVLTCQKYLETLKVNLSFKEIEKLSKNQFKKILKEKTREAGFDYLNKQKNKQDKIKNIVYSTLKMQDYLADGDRNKDVTKLIFKARGKTLDIKLHKKWKYDDTLCVGCGKNDESGSEVLQCIGFGEMTEKVTYSAFFSSSVDEQIKVGKEMLKRLKKRLKMREEVT